MAVRRVCDVAIRADEGDTGVPRRSELHDVAKGFAELLCRLHGRRFFVSIDHHQKACVIVAGQGEPSHTDVLESAVLSGVEATYV